MEPSIFSVLLFASTFIGAWCTTDDNRKWDIGSKESVYLIGQADGKSFFTAIPTDLTDGMSWDEWTNFCQRNGFYTASVESQGQNDLVNSFWTAFPDSRPLWLGAMDVNKEQNFYWMRSYENLNYANWADGSPTNDTNRNCVYNYKLQFVDVPCTTRWIPLCEYP